MVKANPRVLDDDFHLKPAEVYHGQVLEDTGIGGGDEGEPVADDWHVGKLKFRGKHIDDVYRSGAGAVWGDSRRIDDYAVVDTRGKDPMSLLVANGNGSKRPGR